MVRRFHQSQSQLRVSVRHAALHRRARRTAGGTLPREDPIRSRGVSPQELGRGFPLRRLSSHVPGGEVRPRGVVLTAKHGDEFAMWPSKYTHRNAMETGPKRDVAGDLTTAVRAAGMKMGFYHNTTYTFWDARYPGRDWVEYMNNSIKELVDLYHPSV